MFPSFARHLHCILRADSHISHRFVILAGVIAVMHPLAASKASVSEAQAAKNFSLNAGVAFGEAALQGNVKRSSTCCAETDVELIVVPKDACVCPGVAQITLPS